MLDVLKELLTNKPVSQMFKRCVFFTRLCPVVCRPQRNATQRRAAAPAHRFALM